MTSPATTLQLAVAQFSMVEAPEQNIARAAALVREAHAGGAQVVLLPELFATPYFPREMDKKYFALAHPRAEDPSLRALAPLAKELGVAIPVSFFERDGDRYYNSVVVLDADGTPSGTYRKSHIPDGDGYEEKFYFSPGDSGFRSFKTRYGNLGVAVCWDQWFPECARAMTLLGADVLMYPTAIGSEPVSGRDTALPWRRVMIGHAVSNTIHVAASNRVGNENGQVFYGTSFIADPWGEIVSEFGRTEEGLRTAHIDLAAARADRGWMGLVRDRRPDLYSPLTRTM